MDGQGRIPLSVPRRPPIRGWSETVRILLVNDDGYRAPGIQALYEVLQAEHEVWIVAPDREVSAVGHAITLRHVLRTYRIHERCFSVEGNPTDCVNLALWQILPDRPDAVISGINAGWNLAEDVTYSGTVAGAMEGTIHKIFSIAVSLAPDVATWERFLTVARWLNTALPALRAIGSPRVFFNINWPRVHPPRGLRWTRLGTRLHPNQVLARTDPRGETYYWISRGEPEWEEGPDVDVHVVTEGFVSITPLTIDWTDEAILARLQRTSVDLPWPGA